MLVLKGFCGHGTLEVELRFQEAESEILWRDDTAIIEPVTEERSAVGFCEHRV